MNKEGVTEPNGDWLRGRKSHALSYKLLVIICHMSVTMALTNQIDG